MLKVGKHENIGFSASINDKGTLVIVAKQVGAPEVEEEDFMAALGGSEATIETQGGGDDTTQNFLIFPITPKGYENKELVEVRSAKAIAQEVGNFRALLSYILSNYTDLNEVEWNPYADSDYTTDNVKPTTVQTQEYLDTVYKNLSTQFVEQLAKFGDKEKGFRVVFPRTSKKSHYPKLRQYGLKENPFMESMEVPAEESKIDFTKGEKDAKLDNGDILAPSQSAADKDTSSLGDSGL